ncbi:MULTISPECIES: Mbeg1-like protein [Lactobacillus]|uniref:DUF2974 domain-containing protein n=1 Tax=Lactobacillus xujianguonis TaxID=2495899 RepID=A0A437SV23_9LACO|nr:MULTISPECIES: Mbeg1-like protein [Lactobacillus]RVU70667.1 DUF2974 domain-containing protein [Lactobacillus xujianguonis]RVU73856.1 DUF2974 domain-containing protein [Lactobacillus xujianguonis]
MYPDNNIFSYLKWRGDIDLAKAPFNEIDALVLAVFSYLDLPKIVSSGNKTITISEAAKRYFAPNYDNNDHVYYQRLLKLMAEADRFKNAKLSNFVNTLTDQTQFSAIKIQLEDGTNFISFRGTDDSLVGWKEDFEISFKTTIAQKQAKEYLEKIMRHDDQHYLLGGHSKGGNLAEYAAINIEPKFRNRIDYIYTFDSPGIAKEVGAQLPSKFLQEKLKRFVPEFSIIGRLFEPQTIKPVIVDSSRPGLAQHDAFSWTVNGSHFSTEKHRNPKARIYNQLINDWIGDATLTERESLTNDLFDSLAASGSDKINQLNKNGFGGFGAILFSLTGSSRRTRFVFGSLFSAIWQNIKSHISSTLFTVDSIIGWVMLVLGIISLTVPQYALRAFGILVAFAGIGYSVKQIIDTAQSKLQNRQKRFFIVSWLIIFALSVALISNNRLLIFLAHYFLGTFLIIYSYIRIRQLILRRIKGVFHVIITAIEALIAFALGIIVIVNPQYFTKRSIVIAGALLIAYGFFKLIGEVFLQRKKIPRKHR